MPLFIKNTPYLFLIKFLLCFFALYLFFPFYWGITGVGGKMYSPFLDSHLNIIRGLTRFLAGASRLILEAFHYPVFQKDFHSLRIGYSGNINVNPACLGWGVMSFWVAFVFANSGTWKHKLKWMFSGLFFICVLNIARITFITIAIHLRWKSILSFNHHTAFNIISYGCIFVLMYYYITIQKRYELQNKLKNKRKKSALFKLN